jgi:hypothetical protein
LKPATIKNEERLRRDSQCRTYEDHDLHEYSLVREHRYDMIMINPLPFADAEMSRPI